MHSWRQAVKTTYQKFYLTDACAIYHVTRCAMPPKHSRESSHQDSRKAARFESLGILRDCRTSPYLCQRRACSSAFLGSVFHNIRHLHRSVSSRVAGVLHVLASDYIARNWGKITLF